MSTFILKTDEIDVSEIRQRIINYLATNPEGLQSEQFLQSSAGKLIVDILAGTSSLKAYNTIVGRREAYLKHSINRSSKIAGAEFNGYSTYRGENTRMLITFTPDSTQTISKFDIIGSVNDLDLISLEDKNLISGQSTTLTVTYGTVDTENITVVDDQPTSFPFQKSGISEDIQVYLNGTAVDQSKRLIDATFEKFVIMTNPLESVDVFYLNNDDYSVRFDTGDDLSIKFIYYSDQAFALNDVILDIGTQTDLVITQELSEPESDSSIAVNAPLYKETQFVIRAREDYHKVLRLIDSSIIETGYRDISAMIIALLYIKDDLTLLTGTEKQDRLNQLIAYRVAGLQPPEFDEPIRLYPTLDINVTIDSVNAELITKIDEVVAEYEKVFGIALSFSKIEQAIESVSGVRIARVSMGSTVWLADTVYKTGQHVSFGNPTIIQKLERIIYRSGGFEPVWPTTLGNTINDGRVVWRAKYFEMQCDPLNPQQPLVPPRPIWSANTEYKIGDIVIPTVLGIHEYEVVDFLNYTDSVEPTWTTNTGDTLIDGEIVYIVREQFSTSSITWSAGLNVKKGDLILPTTPNGYFYQCVGFVRKSLSTIPTFTTIVNDITVEGDIAWRAVDKNVSPFAITRNQFYLIGKNTNIAVAND